LVEVAITDRTVRNVLAVPVDALLARAAGGYAVEVVASDGTHQLVRVSLGLFDDAAGKVQASGPGLAAGQRVVVPGE
jgi:multidrug efflux pump subunit AcrA (membrane-fusion protein)